MLAHPITEFCGCSGQTNDTHFRSQHEKGKLPLDNDSKKDLERRKIIDVLADRESATVEAWLKEHPEVELVIRDRGKDFTKAATVGAPQAQQVVDRFHVVVRRIGTG